MVRVLPLEEKFQLVGVATSLVCYGINVCLLIQLFTAKNRAKLWTNALTLVLFLVASTFQFLISYVTLVGCIDHHEHSGEVPVCADIRPFAGSQVAIQSTGMIATLLPDFFVLYQCYIVYSLRRRDLWVFGFPVLFLLSSSGSGIYLMLSTNIDIEIFPHYPLCIFTKFLLTSLIVAKLFRHRRRLRENFEDNPEGPIRPYTSLIYILIQSYTLHASLSILFLGLYLAGNSAWRMVLPNHVQAGLMSHLLVRSQVIRSRNENKHAGPKKGTSEPIRFSEIDSQTSTSTTNAVGNV